MATWAQQVSKALKHSLCGQEVVWSVRGNSATCDLRFCKDDWFKENVLTVRLVLTERALGVSSLDHPDERVLLSNNISTPAQAAYQFDTFCEVLMSRFFPPMTDELDNEFHIQLAQ